MKCGNCQSLFPKLEFANNSTICKLCKTYFKFIKKSKSDNCYQCTLCSHQDMQMKRLLLHLQNEHPTITGIPNSVMLGKTTGTFLQKVPVISDPQLHKPKKNESSLTVTKVSELDKNNIKTSLEDFEQTSKGFECLKCPAKRSKKPAMRQHIKEKHLKQLNSNETNNDLTIKDSSNKDTSNRTLRRSSRKNTLDNSQNVIVFAENIDLISQNDSQNGSQHSNTLNSQISVEKDPLDLTTQDFEQVDTIQDWVQTQETKNKPIEKKICNVEKEMRKDELKFDPGLSLEAENKSKLSHLNIEIKPCQVKVIRITKPNPNSNEKNLELTGKNVYKENKQKLKFNPNLSLEDNKSRLGKLNTDIKPQLDQSFDQQNVKRITRSKLNLKENDKNVINEVNKNTNEVNKNKKKCVHCQEMISETNLKQHSTVCMINSTYFKEVGKIFQCLRCPEKRNSRKLIFQHIYQDCWKNLSITPQINRKFPEETDQSSEENHNVQAKKIKVESKYSKKSC